MNLKELYKEMLPELIEWHKNLGDYTGHSLACSITYVSKKLKVFLVEPKKNSEEVDLFEIGFDGYKFIWCKGNSKKGLEKIIENHIYKLDKNKEK